METTTLAPVVKTVHVGCSVERAFEVFTREIDSWWPLDRHALHPGEVAAVTWEEREGGEVFEHTRALDIDAAERKVMTDVGTIRAETIILATHLPFPQSGAYYARCKAMRSYAIAVNPSAASPPPRGMYISIDEPMRSIRSTSDGRILVGGEGHKVGEDDDTTQRYAALESWASEHFAGTVEHR